MKWFKKQTDYKVNNRYIEKIQLKWSAIMQDLTKKLSKRALIIILVVFVAGFGIYFGYILYRSFKIEVSGRFEVIQISKTSPPVSNSDTTKISTIDSLVKKNIKSNN